MSANVQVKSIFLSVSHSCPAIALSLFFLSYYSCPAPVKHHSPSIPYASKRGRGVRGWGSNMCEKYIWVYSNDFHKICVYSGWLVVLTKRWHLYSLFCRHFKNLKKGENSSVNCVQNAIKTQKDLVQNLTMLIHMASDILQNYVRLFEYIYQKFKQQKRALFFLDRHWNGQLFMWVLIPC